jgi:hypothetical protein
MKTFETFIAEKPIDQTPSIGTDEQHSDNEKPSGISSWQSFSERQAQSNSNEDD